jgi:hypothetical protein
LERDPPLYQPGEVLVGQYRIDMEPDKSVKAVECSVIWLTEGKGDEDVGVHFFERRSKSTLAIDQLKRPHKISTVLPPSPLSYSGQLVKIRWSLRLRVFIDDKEYLEDSPFQLGKVTTQEYENIESDETR